MSWFIWSLLMITPILVAGDYGSTRVDTVIGIDNELPTDLMGLNYATYVPLTLVGVFAFNICRDICNT